MTAAPEASSYGAAASRWADSLGGGKEEGGGRRPGKGTCKAVWHEELAVFEVLQPRGDSLKSMGSTWRGRTMLHAEEGLWLAERGMLTVHPLPTIPAEQHTAAMAAVAGLTPESTRAADTRNEAEEGSTAAGKRGGRAEARPTAAGPKEATLSPPPRCARAAPCVPQPPQTVASTVAKPLPATRNPYGHNGGGGGGGEGGGGGGDGGGGGGGDGNGDGDGGDAAVTVPVCAGELPSNPQRQFATAVPTRPPLVADNAGPRCPDTGKVSSAAYESSPTLPGGGPHDMPAEAGLVRGYGVGVGSGEGRRRGAKRGRGGGVGDGERLTLSVGEMFEILARAGVPWECYRAYAELKRRSYVVRRRMEDTIGHDERAPRAAPLPWFGRKRTLPAAGWAPADNAANRENITATPAPAPTTFSFPPFSSSPSSSSSHPSFFPSYKGDVNPIPSSATPSSFLPSAPPPPPPSPHLPPVTFHVYNPTSAFRKRNPGPPDSVLAVCRFEDPMPPHGALVALADHHARLRQVGGGATPDPDPSSQDQDAVGPGTGRQEGRRGGGGSAGGGGGSEAAGEGAAAMGVEGGAAEAGFPMVKLAVVSAEAGVQLFDVCSHDPSTAAGSDPAEVSDKYRGLK